MWYVFPKYFKDCLFLYVSQWSNIFSSTTCNNPMDMSNYRNCKKEDLFRYLLINWFTF